MRWLLPLLLALLAGCAGTREKAQPQQAAVRSAGPVAAADCSDFRPYPPAQEDPSTRGDYVAGGLYKPGVRDSTPDELPRVDCIPEPAVVHEPRSAHGNRTPYRVLGRSYSVLDRADGYVESGTASYYGNKFHGRRTSNQEVYDMYAFTAAHKSLPLPSFARVTNLDNGRSVVVRVNDRGPFHEGRIIDLSYAAAVKLDIQRRGTGRVEVRALSPDEAAPAAAPSAAAVAPAAAASTAAPASATALDAWVATPAVSATVAAALPAGQQEENRFRMVENGRVRSADEFDAWMHARQERYAAYQRQYGDAAPGTTAAAPPPTLAAATPVAVAPPVPVAAAAASGTWLQVGVFSVRANAENALGRLRAAGIAPVGLHEDVAGGRQLWRVRVGPVAAGAVGELSSRVAGLGFGQPHPVRE